MNAAPPAAEAPAAPENPSSSDEPASARWWTRPPSPLLSGWAQLLANLVVVVAVGLAVWQVRELRADRRRDNAMQFVMLLHGQPYADTALGLSIALQEGAPATDPRLSLPNVQQLGDMYMSAILCRKNGVCDIQTIDANFRDNVAGFYGLTYDDELVRLSCRLKRPPDSYGAPMRDYLDKTRRGDDIAAPAVSSTRRCN